MKQNEQNTTVIQLDQEALNHLVTEVKETLINKTQFSAADLWNIQRNMKTAKKSQNRWILN